MVFRKTKINIQAPFATLSTEKKKQVFYAKTKDDEQYKHRDNHNILS